jgi:hypothetical protein
MLIVILSFIHSNAPYSSTYRPALAIITVFLPCNRVSNTGRLIILI